MNITMDPTTMTEDEYQAALDREDGRGKLHHYGAPGRSDLPITAVLDYTIRDGNRVAVVEVVTMHYGKPRLHTYEVPAESMHATKRRRPPGLQPVPWC